MDYGCVGISECGDTFGGALGLCGFGVGWVLGLGSGGECVAAAMDYGDCVSAFGDDAGETRDDEGLECVAGVHHLHALHSGDIAYALWCGEFGACVRAVVDWELVCGFSGACFYCLLLGLLAEPGLFAQRQSVGFAGVARVELSFQQSHSPCGLLFGSL